MDALRKMINRFEHWLDGDRVNLAREQRERAI